MSLVSDSEMAALRAVALSGMVSSVAIYRRTTEQTDNGQKNVYPATPSSTVSGWLYEMTGPGAALGVLDGAIAISELFRLLLPVGTTISSGDKVILSGADYIVQHLNEDNTYKPALVAIVRKVE